MFIIPALFDDLGLRQVFRLGERDIGPVFTWPQFDFRSRRSLFHSSPVYPKTCFLGTVPQSVAPERVICGQIGHTKGPLDGSFARFRA